MSRNGRRTLELCSDAPPLLASLLPSITRFNSSYAPSTAFQISSSSSPGSAAVADSAASRIGSRFRTSAIAGTGESSCTGICGIGSGVTA